VAGWKQVISCEGGSDSEAEGDMEALVLRESECNVVTEPFQSPARGCVETNNDEHNRRAAEVSQLRKDIV